MRALSAAFALTFIPALALAGETEWRDTASDVKIVVNMPRIIVCSLLLFVY